MNHRPELRLRALRAALAVTLGQAVLGCGTADSTVDRDVIESDAVADADAGSGDVAVDTSPTCSAVSDGVCDPSCTQDSDYDCCVVDSWCSWFENGCGCAVEGPFAPPSLALRAAVA
jgi:hypothetical protein